MNTEIQPIISSIQELFNGNPSYSNSLTANFRDVQLDKVYTRFLLHRLIDHNIYHAAQIAYVNKLLQ
jgi:hypothetical protein